MMFSGLRPSLKKSGRNATMREPSTRTRHHMQELGLVTPVLWRPAFSRSHIYFIGQNPLHQSSSFGRYADVRNE
jgi:hypothetical protein